MTTSSKESAELQHVDHADASNGTDAAALPVQETLTATSTSEAVVGYETDLTDLPKGYFTSRFFLGSMLAVGLGLTCAVSCFGYAAPILAQINDDLGPDPRYIWISLVYNAVLAVGLALVGRLSDIFGRRYWFIGGGAVGVVGAIVCATAKTIPVLVGGNVLLGLATSTQLSFHFVMGELVPMRYRYVGNAFLYCFTFPGSGVGPSIAFAFVQRPVGWRGVYWLLLALEGAALVCWVLFYFPPSFAKVHADARGAQATKTYWIKHFDYVGTVLFSGGFVVFLLGLSWGGSVYPWNAAGTIGPIVVGGVTLVVFVLWEMYAPLREPLLPMHLFRNVEWVAACVLLGLGAGVYYAFAIIWPAQAAVMYNSGGSLTYLGGISNIVGLGIISGQVVGGLLAEKIGRTRYQCMVVFSLGAVFLAAMAATNPARKGLAIALLTVGCFFIGWNETVCLANATICVRNQREIGVAGGMAGSLRAAICAVLVAVYSTVLANRLTQTVSSEVPPAVVAAGLPQSSVAAFLAALAAGTADAFAAVPGITADIIAAGTQAYKVANADAYRTVYLSTIAFSGVALAMTWFAPDTEQYMSAKIVATLHNEHGEIVDKTEPYEEQV
ncbi:siderophore iron transporter [Sporothrix schenckii 1099-18]|uniref:Siderophore iron transporter n=1 Tax=Sporothrix schenckii 1099-18 TaxID=1397361 RepID=A0A0F2MB11_SPOSC|nr:siderophore iron transporter [Sporothrix schenckii 1099-18]KJR86888.1 siderophore iron transporter [Sporothrix schenckii 1099-18]